MQILILGLRRSGTTAFWETFRQDPRFVAYNEPFNPLIRHICDPVWIDRYEAYREFRDLWDRNPAGFWHLYRAIQGLEEIQEDLSDAQASYLGYLLSNAEHSVCDLTRAHYKLASLAKLAPEAAVVHLHRSPGSFATSHLVPSGQQIPRRGDPLRVRAQVARNALYARLNRSTFWSRRDRYDYWGVEGIVGRSPDSLFGLRLDENGLDPVEIYRMPALGRLLAYWKVHHRHLEEQGPRHFGGRFMSVSFEEFCDRPADIVRRVYALLGADAPADLDTSGIHPARGRYRPEHPDWGRYAERLDLPELLG